jgi:hypothetical protein
MDVSMRRTPSTALVESPEETVEVGGPSRAIETSQEMDNRMRRSRQGGSKRFDGACRVLPPHVVPC